MTNREIEVTNGVRDLERLKHQDTKTQRHKENT
jgi:hypothetical protein